MVVSISYCRFVKLLARHAAMIDSPAERAVVVEVGQTSESTEYELYGIHTSAIVRNMTQHD